MAEQCAPVLSRLVLLAVLPGAFGCVAKALSVEARSERAHLYMIVGGESVTQLEMQSHGGSSGAATMDIVEGIAVYDDMESERERLASGDLDPPQYVALELKQRIERVGWRVTVAPIRPLFAAFEDGYFAEAWPKSVCDGANAAGADSILWLQVHSQLLANYQEVVFAPFAWGHLIACPRVELLWRDRVSPFLTPGSVYLSRSDPFAMNAFSKYRSIEISEVETRLREELRELSSKIAASLLGDNRRE